MPLLGGQYLFYHPCGVRVLLVLHFFLIIPKCLWVFMMFKLLPYEIVSLDKFVRNLYDVQELTEGGIPSLCGVGCSKLRNPDPDTWHHVCHKTQESCLTSLHMS